MVRPIAWTAVNVISASLMVANIGIGTSNRDTVPDTSARADVIPMSYEFPQKLSVEIPVPEKPPEPAPRIVPVRYVRPPAAIEPSQADPMFSRYGAEYGVDAGVLKSIAKCESGYRPEATNGQYGGMYQFHPATWASTRKRMGLDEDPGQRFVPEEAVKTAAFKISHDGTGAWPVCGRM